MSTASFPFTERDLTELLEQSRKDNLKKDITGLLLYAGENFMQLLEGQEKDVLELMERIKKDERHHDVIIMETGNIGHRQFPDWAMGFLDSASPAARALPGYSDFLDGPLSVSELAKPAARSVQLLTYFKAVMIANTSSLEKLMGAMHQKEAVSASNESKRKKTK